MFAPPTWIEGTLIYIGIIVVLPLILAGIVGLISGKIAGDGEIGFASFLAVLFCGIAVMGLVSGPIWHYTYEIPSVNEKVIVVAEWQPKPGVSTNDYGVPVINSADDLLLITSEQEGFLNEENFLFGKFNTRDVFLDLKVGGTYKIRYYGWREGFNSGFPNILSVEEVIDEKNATKNEYSKYFGVKLAT